jgi:hypothetical protein
MVTHEQRGNAMRQRQRGRAPGRLGPVLAGVVLAGLGLALPARAEGERTGGALAQVPADASFYSAMLRNKEQIDLIAKSKAWAAIRELPAYQMAWQLLQAQYKGEDGKLAPVRQFFDQPDNQELLALVGDAVSDEVFCYGAANWVQLSELMTMVNNAQQWAPMLDLIEKGEPDKKAGPRAMLRAAAAHPELIAIPDVVIGFKLTDTERAHKQLRRLEMLATALTMQNPALKDRFKPAKVGNDRFLTVTLDGEMLPWDDISLKDLEEKEGEFDGLVKKIKELKLTVGLGVRGNYLLLSIGSSIDVVGQVGGAGRRLADVPELKPVLAASGQRLTSVGYASAALRAQSRDPARTMGDMLRVARRALASAKVDPEKRKQVEKDLEELSREAQKNLPVYGAEVAFAYLTDRGYENFAYDYTKEQFLDGSKPLTLLEHVGGNPILAGVLRSKTKPESYRDFVKWARKFYGHIEGVVLDKLEKEQKDVYEKISAEVFPLLKRLDTITGTMLLPALADGQTGFVLDAKWASKQWHRAMPEAEKAMPMAEVALVLGVSDADLLRKALSGYREVINDAIAKARQMTPPGKVPDFQVPPPQTQQGKAGTLYSYPFPEQWGLDPQVVPTGGLSDRVAVLTFSHSMADRLLQARPLKVQGGPLAARIKQPLASAGYFDWPALVNALTPWVELAVHAAPVEKFVPGAGDEAGAAKAREDILRQVRTVLRVMKVIRGSTSATYVEDGVLVTHGETVIRDLDGR